MKCSFVQNLFGEYLQGSLSPEEIASLEHHLHSCEACKTKWETYRVFFSDTQIEQDFPVPAQLNAKIKYTLQQAKNKKKTPFYRNKQVLSYATACCFLLMVGLFGTSHFEQIKQDVTQPALVSESGTEPLPNTPEETPEQENAIPKTVSEQTPKLRKTVTQPTKEVLASPAPETNYKTEELFTDSKEQTQNAVTEFQPEAAVVSDTTAPSSDPISYARHGGGGLPLSEYPADFVVAEGLRSRILDSYPYTQLSETVFSVQIPESSLEELLGISIETEETKTEYTIEFISE